MEDKKIPAPEHDPRHDGKPHGGPHPDDPHQGDHHHNEKPKKEKRRRRRPGLVLFLLLFIVILLALIWFFRDGFGLGGGSGGRGTPSGTNNSSNTSSSSADSSDASSDNVSEITEIRIVENDIYIGSEKCADANDLKDKLTARGKDKKYKLVHDTAIKETYDKVKEILLGLKDSLGIEVDFNE